MDRSDEAQDLLAEMLTGSNAQSAKLRRELESSFIMTAMAGLLVEILSLREDGRQRLKQMLDGWSKTVIDQYNQEIDKVEKAVAEGGAMGAILGGFLGRKEGIEEQKKLAEGMVQEVKVDLFTSLSKAIEESQQERKGF